MSQAPADAAAPSGTEIPLTEESAATIMTPDDCAEFIKRLSGSGLPLAEKSRLMTIAFYTVADHRFNRLTSHAEMRWTARRDGVARDHIAGIMQNIESKPLVFLKTLSYASGVKQHLRNAEIKARRSAHTDERAIDPDTLTHSPADAPAAAEPVTGPTWKMFESALRDTDPKRQSDFTRALLALRDADVSEDYLIGILTDPPKEASEKTGIPKHQLVSQRARFMKHLAAQAQDDVLSLDPRKARMMAALIKPHSRAWAMLESMFTDSKMWAQTMLTRKLRELSKTMAKADIINILCSESDAAAQRLNMPPHAFREERSRLFANVKKALNILDQGAGRS